MNEVCIHEAGHAIAALSYGLSVEYMTFTPWDEKKGSSYRCESQDNSQNRIVALAGLVAVSLYKSNFNQVFNMNAIGNYGGDSDLHKALAYGPRNDYELVISIEDALRCAWNLLFQKRATLVKLANELETKKYLTKLDVERIVLNKDVSIVNEALNAIVRNKMRLRMWWLQHRKSH